MRRLGATVVALLGFGCQPPEPELPPIVWEGEHLRYRSDESVDSICGGTFQHLDERVAHIAEIFNLPPGVVVDYSWTPGEAILEYCDSSSLGCSVGTSAFSMLVSSEHELLHATRETPAHRGLEEGLAVMFGDGRARPGEIDGDIEQALRSTGASTLLDESEYSQVGHFVSYLRAEFGQDGLAALDRRSDITHDYAQLSASIEAEFGVPMEDLLADYTARYPICQPTQYRYDGFECERESTTLVDNGEGINARVPIGCDDPLTLGPRAGKIWKTLSFQVPEDGRYFITVITYNAFPARVTIDECGSSCFDIEEAYHIEGSALMWLGPCLRQGTYTLTLEVEADARGDFEIEIRQMFAQICD